MSVFIRRFRRAACADECYAVAFLKKIYFTLDELQKDLDIWLEDYNRNRTHQGKYCFGKTPYQTFVDDAKLAWKKRIEPDFLLRQQTVS